MASPAAPDTEAPFASALFLPESQPAIHLIELAMRDLSYAIRSKPSWWTKCSDPAIREKWTNEAQQQTIRGFKLQKEHIDYVLDELKIYERARTEAGVQPGLQRGFWEADTLVPEKLHADLVKEVQKLRNVPDDEKDWHPGSDGQVLDLVHPSMYCMRYGNTVLTNGNVAQAPPLREHEDFTRLHDRSFDTWDNDPANVVQRSGHSLTTSWLPTDFEISQDGSQILPRGYINNIHPQQQRSLQSGVLTLLEKFLPLFQSALGDLRSYSTDTIFGTLQSELDESKRPLHPKTGKPLEPWGNYSDDEDEDEDEDGDTLYDKWIRNEQPYIDPKPAAFVDDETHPALGTGYTLNGRNIQVITKIAGIHLTPEKPDYNGGSWHVEGMLNESIVATGLYYLTCENITTSKLGFRVALESEGPTDYEQEDPQKLLLRSYGLERDTPLNQYLGSFEARQGRAIVFPNLYQHKVEPFRLADPTKPGRRTIVAFFLCDPTYRVLSTTDVPPQQIEWRRGQLYKECKDSKLLSLAPELKDRVLDELLREKTLLDRAGAEEVRAQLMEERSHFQISQNEDVFEAGFSLCEH